MVPTGRGGDPQRFAGENARIVDVEEQPHVADVVNEGLAARQETADGHHPGILIRV